MQPTQTELPADEADIADKNAPLQTLPYDSHEWPRERLRDRGPLSLSDAELLALLFGSGIRGANVLEIARAALSDLGSLHALANATLTELTQLPGVGPARAALLQAAVEIGRRSAGTKPLRGHRLARPSDVWTHYQARLGGLSVEEFWILGLDARHRFLFENCCARGSLTGVEVHPRDIFRQLIREGAAAAIFIHNHPSGDPEPSAQDIDLTKRMRKVGELCGVPILDHVVVAADGHVSLAARGWL